MNKETLHANLKNIAKSFGLSGSVSATDFGALIFGILKDEGYIDEDQFVEIMAEIWPDFPKNASAMRQMLFESSGKDSSPIDPKEALRAKYLKS